jgi:hypothetical protein
MATCGLWPTRRGVVAIIVDDDGVARGPARCAARTAESYWALLAEVEAHEGLDCRFVVTDETLAAEPRLGKLAAHRGASVLVVSRALVDGLRVLTGQSRAPPKRLALLLARLPLCAPLMPMLAPLRLQLDLL